MQAIIDQIKAKRKALGLTQEDVAQKTGLKRSNIARLENGGNATLNTLSKVCEAIGLTIVTDDRDHIWIDRVSFVGAENHIRITWRYTDETLKLQFRYKGNEYFITAPEIGNNKNEVSLYNTVAEWTVDFFIQELEAEEILKEA